MSALDPFRFEVLRHRLSTITVEGATALQRVSGSPLATEAFDMNTAIMTATGEVVFVGPYLLTGPMGQGLIVRWILEHADGDPVAPGDVYLCNDPYAGSAHQNCVTLVAPIHHGGDLIAWAGATLHVVDVGGRTAGQVGIGARSILDEAPPTPPIRIVRRGRLDAEVEAAYLDRSRTPELNALDLRAKLAAVNTIRDRTLDLARDDGPAAIVEVLETTIDRAAEHFRRRLHELPDGTTARTAFVDLAADVDVEHYAVALRLDKRGGRLSLDFRASSPQAPAIVNCTRSGLLSGVLVAVLTTLVWDGPWCPAAIERSIDVVSAAGTVVDARWPAGCSMATMASGFATTTATALAIGDLLARSAGLQERAMAAWAGAVGSVDVFGTDASGRRFGTVLLDTMASGTGASGASDGVDSGGFLRSMACVIANVEHIEAQFPLLYLYRRQEPDTGGAGRRRGGVGVSYAVVPHGVERIETVSPHFSGTLEPESLGLAGGFPGATNAAALARGSTVRSSMVAGRLPSRPDELGVDPRALPAVAAIPLEADDVLIVRATGGGGFGDPLERRPDDVLQDVRSGLVAPPSAERVYGVVIDAGAADGSAIDPAATADRRAAIRRQRREVIARSNLATAVIRDAALGDPEPPDGWTIDATPTGPLVRCLGCGHTEPLSDDEAPLIGYPTASTALDRANGEAVPGPPGARFGLVERYCPACARLLDVDRVRMKEMASDG